MVEAKSKVIGTLGLLVGLIITFFAYYMIPVLADFLPITPLKTIYWIGILSYWVSAVIINPVNMIIAGQGGLKGSFKGLVFFLGGYLLSLMIYYLGGAMIEAFNSIFSNSTYTGVLWFGIYLIWGLSLVVVPTFITLKDGIFK